MDIPEVPKNLDNLRADTIIKAIDKNTEAIKDLSDFIKSSHISYSSELQVIMRDIENLKKKD